jgi:PHD/YefM family antitoxin component YafN of YafNO toxin-antitoxin module|tara:strand:- start:585 stop:791 length:207 start_codon:yes stop_codon:yes gene_type:complete
LQLGFVPILASVKPQVSAHVAIDLEGGSGPSGIYIDEADWKFIKLREQAEPFDVSAVQRPAKEVEPVS